MLNYIFTCDFTCNLPLLSIFAACGHLSCFWCVYSAMNHFLESHCPVCRCPFNHFPSICQLLHFLLLKLYPMAYKKRERQVQGTFVSSFLYSDKCSKICLQIVSFCRKKIAFIICSQCTESFESFSEVLIYQMLENWLL